MATTERMIDCITDAIYLDKKISNEEVRAIFRQVCYVPNFARQRTDLSYRDLRLLQDFGSALEMAYCSTEHWAILWPPALMLISKFNLAALSGRTPASLAALTNQTHQQKGQL